MGYSYLYLLHPRSTFAFLLVYFYFYFSAQLQAVHSSFMEQMLISPSPYLLFCSQPGLASSAVFGCINNRSRGFFCHNSCPPHSTFVPPQLSHLAYLFNFCSSIFNFNFLWFNHEKALYRIAWKTDISQNKKLKCISQGTKKMFKDGMVSI